MKKLIAIAIASLFAANASAEISYKIPLTRDGVQTTRLAYNFWSGEWPGPVIRINSAKPNKYTTIQAWKSPRVLDSQVSCTVKNGVYHPWSNTSNSIINYYTFVALNTYQAKETTVLSWVYEDSKTLVKKGQAFDVVYGAENMCLADIGKETVSFSCDDVANDSNLAKVTPDDDFFEQWIYVTCTEGYNAFFSSEEILTQKGVTEGEFLEYGSVK